MNKYNNSLLGVLNSVYGKENWRLLLNGSLEQEGVLSRIKLLMK